MSIFKMKTKNRISAVEQPKNPQKIFRAKASRKVSRTSAPVTSSDRLFIDGPHENIFERTGGACYGFNFAVFRAQLIDGLIGGLAASEKEFDVAVTRGDGHGLLAQLLLQPLGHMFRFDAVAAASGEIFDLAFERYPAAMNDGHVAAEQLHFG